MPKRSRSPVDEDVPMIDHVPGDDDMDKEIQMDFEFFQFQQEDYHNLKTTLRNYLDGSVYELEELCDELIEQFYVGSAIKIEGNEQFVGLLSAFNITKHAEKQCIKTIKTYFMAHLRNTSEAESLQQLLNGSKGNVALIFSERIESVPVQLAPHLYMQLGNEIEKALQTEKDDRLESFEYNIDYFLLKSRIFYLKKIQNDTIKKLKTESAEMILEDDNDLERCYYNPEEELIEPFADKIWYSQMKTIDCTQPNSMDRQVVSEEFCLFAIPKEKFPLLCAELTKAILAVRS